jgi:hypothetical protein
MRTTITLLALLCAVSGACVASYYPQYESYTTITLDDTYLYQTVVVDGTTTGDCYYPCGCGQYGCNQCPIANCPADHTPSVQNELGDAGGWTTGAVQTMFAYTSLQTTAQLAYVEGQSYPSTTRGRIWCAVRAAFIIDAYIMGWDYSVARTYAKYTSGSTGTAPVILCNAANDCTPATSPPMCSVGAVKEAEVPDCATHTPWVCFTLVAQRPDIQNGEKVCRPELTKGPICFPNSVSPGACTPYSRW